GPAEERVPAGRRTEWTRLVPFVDEYVLCGAELLLRGLALVGRLRDDGRRAGVQRRADSLHRRSRFARSGEDWILQLEPAECDAQIRQARPPFAAATRRTRPPRNETARRPRIRPRRRRHVPRRRGS